MPEDHLEKHGSQVMSAQSMEKCKRDHVHMLIVTDDDPGHAGASAVGVVSVIGLRPLGAAGRALSAPSAAGHRTAAAPR